jgi:archaellum biogenesis ATPase FlaH
MEKLDRMKKYDYYSNVRPTKVEWLWYPYIPFGKLTVLQGDPGDGKSTFMLNLAALLSRGADLPTGDPIRNPMTVIYQCAEDSLADTIKPRLIAAGADCTRIAYILDTDIALTLDDERIEETIKSTGARLFVIDPVQAYIPQDADMQSAQKMRGLMRRLAAVAENQNCAIVTIGHMSKANNKNLYRGLGSIDIMAIARSVLMISRSTSDPTMRYMFAVKSSLAPEGEAIGFRLGTELGFQWLGKCSYDRSDIEESINIAKSKKELATRYLEEMLSESDQPTGDLLQRFHLLGIGERTVNSAKKEMDIKAYRKGGKWFWHLNSMDAK